MVSARVAAEPGLPLSAALARLRADLGLPTGFPEAVLSEAHAAATAGPSIAADDDLRHIPFVTVDPRGARDLDQAVHIERAGASYLVRYAIADVAAFVAPGGAVDREARARGTTVYLPDGRIPLHPPVLSEGAASLLPESQRQAIVWDLTVDAEGELSDVRVRRALVRSRRAYAYEDAQEAIDSGRGDETLTLLRDVGRLRLEQEALRGGVSLELPSQEAVDDSGTPRLRFSAPLPVERWNAQISLMTGMAAAGLMLDAGVGVLRTLPAPDPRDVGRVRRAAAALGVEWPEDLDYASFVRGLSPSDPRCAALLLLAARTLRGAGYSAFDGRPPADPVHAAVAAPYAHVTAPLRRLVDRFANAIVLSAVEGDEPPEWVQSALEDLPGLMASARRREAEANRAAVAVLEAFELAAHVGGELPGAVVATDERGSVVQLVDPAVELRVDGIHALGQRVALRIAAVDLDAARVDAVVV